MLKIDKYLKLYGNHFLSFSVKQSNLNYFHLDSIGFIAYKQVNVGLFKKMRVVVLGNPICSPKDYKKIIKEFLKIYNDATFFMCNDEVALILESYNYLNNKWGSEHYLFINTFDLKGKKRKLIRRWYNKHSKSNYKVEEFEFNESNRSVYQDISNQWIVNKGGSENNFVNRPLEFINHNDVRRFHIKHDSHIYGFIFFDPIYKDNKVNGYYLNIVRYLSNIESGLVSYGILKAMEQFKKENIHIVSLGVAPAIDIKDDKFKFNIPLSKLIQFLGKYCNFLYPARGVHFSKKIYNCNLRNTYYSSLKSGVGEFAVIYNSCKK